MTNTIEILCKLQPDTFLVTFCQIPLQVGRKRASSGLVKKIDMPQQRRKMYEAMAQGLT